MVDLMYVQVIQTLIDLTRTEKIAWQCREIANFPALEPEMIVEKVFFTSYKGRNLILYEERLPPFKPDGETLTRMQIVDEQNAILDEIPNTSGMRQLYATVKIHTRSDVARQLDKVVEALAMATRARTLAWKEENPEIYGIEPDTLTSPVYITEFKGKKFALFYEHAGNSTRDHVHTKPSLWILTPQNQKLRDCDDVLGVDILFRLVNIKQPDFSSLDSVVDALVASTIKSVVSRLKGQDIHAVVAAQAQEMQNQAMQNQAMQASSQASETDTRPDA
jgi:hypothetical protein